MLTAEQERHVLRQAVQRGILRDDQISALAEAKASGGKPLRYGPRLDALLRSGLIDRPLVEELLQELRAAEETTDDLPPLAEVLRAPEKPADAATAPSSQATRPKVDAPASPLPPSEAAVPTDGPLALAMSARSGAGSASSIPSAVSARSGSGGSSALPSGASARSGSGGSSALPSGASARSGSGGNPAVDGGGSASSLPPSASSLDEPTPRVRVSLPLPEPLRKWARYDILDILGQGGMGVVYKARDRRLGRPVALKFIRVSDEKTVQRFLHEARAQARITHENICKVYEVGEVARHPYIAMEYVDGESVLAVNRRLKTPEKVQLIKDVAEALYAAHNHGIIHRDIKPHNILVERRGDGRLRPVLMDFGLARDVQSSIHLTESGVVMGTPGYMSPEQAQGRVGEIDLRSDIYSLGAMLYELLVGRPPFDGTATVQVLIQVLNDEVIPPREIDPTVPRDLEAIVMKCLKKLREERYQTAQALADDLGRALRGEPVEAIGNTLVSRLRFRLHGQVWFLPAVMVAGLLLFAGAFWVVRSQMRAQTEQRIAQTRAALAQQAATDLRELTLFMRAAYAQPLHNVKREREVIGKRLALLEARLPTLEPAVQGPILVALARGLLLVGEAEAAEGRLRQAIATGYDPPEAEEALGRALSLRHAALAEEVRRSPDPLWVSRRLRELDAELLEPARRALTRGLAMTGVESPALGQARLQLLQADYDGAQRSLGHAVAEAPWLPEIALLEAQNARERMFSIAPNAAAATDDPVKTEVERTLTLYARAVDMARSDPAAYLEQALLIETLMQRRLRHGGEIEELGKQLQDACQKALLASPELPGAYILLGSAEAMLAEKQAQRDEDPSLSLKRGLEAIEQALLREPTSLAGRLLGNRLRKLEVASAVERGQDPATAFQTAIEQAQSGVRAVEKSSWLWDDLGAIHLLRGEYEVEHGEDPSAALKEARAAFEQARSLEAGDPTATLSLVRIAILSARHALRQSADPDKLLAAAAPLLDEQERRYPGDVAALLLRSEVLLLQAEQELRSGRSPEKVIATAQSSLEHVRRLRPPLPPPPPGVVHVREPDPVDLGQAQGEILLARWALKNNQPATRPLLAGLALLGGRTVGATDAAPQPKPDARELHLRGELEYLHALSLRSEGKPPDAALHAAELALEQAIADNAQRASTHILLARVHLLSAELGKKPRPAQKPAQKDEKKPDTALLQGLRAVAAALKIDPGRAEALAIQGRLLLRQAQRAPKAEQASAAEPARLALDRALQRDPLLAAEFGLDRERAQALSSPP